MKYSNVSKSTELKLEIPKYFKTVVFHDLNIFPCFVSKHAEANNYVNHC